MPHSTQGERELGIPQAVGPHTHTHMHAKRQHKQRGRNKPCCLDPETRVWVMV